MSDASRLLPMLLFMLTLPACSPRPHQDSVANEPSSQKVVEHDNAAPVPVSPSETIRSLVASEELLLQLTPSLKLLNNSVINLDLPDHRSAALFAQDLKSQSLFASIFESVSYFDRATFKFVKGSFEDELLTRFHSDVQFHGLGKSPDGRWISVEAAIECKWQRRHDGQSDDWTIAAWETSRINRQYAEALMYREVLDQLLSTQSLVKARESGHWQLANRHFYPERRARAKNDDNRFFEISTATHPGVSVVDIDGDGFDDLYICVRLGKNLLFRNRGDGTFEEVAGELGLDIDGHSNAAIFADFDNDGDPDAAVARSFDRSIVLVNENGTFVDRSDEKTKTLLPFEATSVSAADYNNDGLIDLYFSTYHQDDIQNRIDADLSHPSHRIHQYLTAEHSAELKRRHREENRSFVNQVGPPNVLLQNSGSGTFKLAPEQPSVAVWRNSFQSTWSDMDDDGDPDLYVANDFAPDQLLRNDDENGFTDVSRSRGIDTIGFGMGVSWGDYDNDGSRDLYVSNMYSKAGLRITDQIHGIDRRIQQLSQGNHLYRRQPAKFDLVSGLTPPALAVSRAGWSWGGQFVDVNNDSFLDLYVPNGYYTAPEEFSSTVDL